MLQSIKNFLCVTMILICLVIASAFLFTSNENLSDAQHQKSPIEIQHLGSGESNSTPSIASLENWVVIVWTSMKDGHTNVYAATSSNGGKQFAPPIRVNDAGADADVYGENPPRVVISHDKTPRIFVTWSCGKTSKFRLRSALSIDGGKSFSPSISVGDSKIDGVRGFQALTVGSQSVVRASWLDSRRDPGTPPHANSGHDWDPMHLMYAFNTAGNSWQR